MGGPVDPDSLTLLKVCRDQVDAMSVRSLLEAEGIEVFIQGENHRAMEGALLGAMIELRAMVRARDLDDARELIEELDYAEHLPAETVEPDPGDKSLQQFQAREIVSIETNRDPAKAALLAVVIPFGAGHYYAHRPRFAAALAVLQALNIAFSPGVMFWRTALLLVLCDALFAGVAIRRDRERAKLQD